MTLEQTVQAFKEHQKKMLSYFRASNMLYYDSVTAMPRGGADTRGTTMGVLSEASYKLKTDPAYKEMLLTLESRKDELDLQTRREVEELLLEQRELEAVPMKEYVDFQVLVNESQQVWREAKLASDYSLFEPYMQGIIDYKRRFIDYTRKPGVKKYEVLLNEIERGIKLEQLDNFYDRIRQTLVPMIHQIQENGWQPKDDFLYVSYPIEKQKILSNMLMRYINMDPNRTAIAESEHPFTIEFGKHDVRITTHYYENDFASNMFVVLHEGGHALYKLNWDEKFLYSPLAACASGGMNESQSRFWENIIGHSRAFSTYILPKLKELFPTQLEGVTVDEFYPAVNRVKTTPIRTRADEFTYSLHLMVRYELEKSIFESGVNAKELPERWNALYKEYLGIDVPDDAHGILQDVHWSQGHIRGFISYAMGNAYSAQIGAAMRKDLDVDQLVATGETRPILDWLVQRVHHDGLMIDSKQVLANCGYTEFDPGYYLDYLVKKYSDIYHLS